MRFILEFAPSKVHVLPVRISHFVALIALGYGVPLVVQDGLHLLRHCDVHRLDFPAEQLGKRQSEKKNMRITVCARAAPSNATQANVAASRGFQLVRDRRSRQCART